MNKSISMRIASIIRSEPYRYWLFTEIYIYHFEIKTLANSFEFLVHCTKLRLNCVIKNENDFVGESAYCVALINEMCVGVNIKTLSIFNFLCSIWNIVSIMKIWHWYVCRRKRKQHYCSYSITVVLQFILKLICLIFRWFNMQQIL